MFDQCPDEVDADTLPPENQHHSYPVMISFAGVWFAGTLSMLLLCPMDYEPSTWSINRWLLPWFPSLAILLIVFSAASLEVVAFKAMGYFTIALVLVYLFFSMPLSYIRHYKLGQDAEDDTM